MISTKSVQEGKSQFPQRLDPGIHMVQIVDITSGVSAAKKTPYIEFTFENAYGNHRETFYMKEGDSMKISLEKIKHLATKIVTEAELDAVAGNTVTDYAAGLAKLLKGTLVRIKLVGKEQYNAAKQKTYVERSFGFYPFAENSSVPDAQTMLKYNPNNKSDYKPLASASGASTDPMGFDAVTTDVADDMPF